MLVNDFFKITKIIPKKINYRFYTFIFLLLISSFLELVSISALIPIAELFIEGQTSFKFLENFFKEISKFFNVTIDVYFILILFMIVIIIKTIFLIFFFILD